MNLTCIPDTGSYPTYDKSSFPGTLYFPKGFKCVFAATDHHANDLPKTGIPKGNGEND